MSGSTVQTRVTGVRTIGVPVREYLAAVLPGLNNRSIQRVAQLTPDNWSRSIKPLHSYSLTLGCH